MFTAMARSQPLRVLTRLPFMHALVFLIMASTSLAWAQTDDLQEASKLLRAGQHAQALERVNKVLSAKPRDAQARFLKGLIFTEQGNTREAVDIFQKLTQDFPDLPEPYNNLAVIYAGQGQYEKARAALEQSIRTHPSYATAYENLGDVYAKLASQAYDKALQLDSSNSAAQNKLALVRDLIGGAPRGTVVAAAKPPAKPAATVVTETKPAAEPSKAVSTSAAVPAPTAAAPVAAAPEPKPAATKPAAEKSSAGEDEVMKTVQAWAAAWSKKDVDGYLALYARDFKTPGGESRSDWSKARRDRIMAPKSIAVSVENPRVSIQGDHATVSFKQKYRSDLRTVNSGKTLVLVRSGNRWLIQQEKVGS